MRGRLVEYATLNWVPENRDASASRFFLPYSLLYDDIYFAERGLEETAHVFLNGNDLSTHFAKNNHFCIAETGFGSGLNILSAWKLWESIRKPEHASLHFLSFEKHPFHPDDLTKAHSAWPELASFSEKLQHLWPPNVAGFHRLELAPFVSLTLYFGDVADGLIQCPPDTPCIDAWFLDGFAPGKNPDMWSQTVFNAMANISREGATCATFTVAGAVRRGLTEAGFEITKAPGYGRKREMLTGSFHKSDAKNKISETNAGNNNDHPWYLTKELPPLPLGSDVAIIGGGIAGASLAFALTQQGYQPTIYERNHIASGASGNPVGLIMPRLDRADNTPARFSLHAYLYTIRILKSLQNQHPDIALYNPCGSARLASEREKQQQISSLATDNLLPESWIKACDEGIIFPEGGVISPPDFVSLLIDQTPIINDHIISLEQDSTDDATSQAWRLHTDAKTYKVDAIILSNGLGALSMLPARGLPLTGSLGQIDVFANAHAPDMAVSYGPYASPLPISCDGHDGKANIGLALGATYRAITPEEYHLNQITGEQHSPTTAATHENISKISKYRPELTTGLDPYNAQSRASIRCMTPDFLPIVGALPDWGFYGANYDGLRNGRVENYPTARYQKNIFALTGLGSRGLVTAPLAAAMIATQLAGAPPPVTADIYNILHPGRFFIRSLKHG